MMIQKIKSVLSVIRLSEFDQSTEEGRAKERLRRVSLTALASVAAKVTSMLTLFISIPLTLHYLGAERFGLWMTISSVIAMLSFADMGIGNGLLTAIAHAHGRDDHAAIRRYISSATAILSAIALTILCIFFFAYPFIPWAKLFNVSNSVAIQESGWAVAAFVVCFALNIVLSSVQRVQLALQMGFVANLWQIAASILALGAVLVVIHFRLGLPWLVGAMSGAPLLITILNGLVFFTRIKPQFRPSPSLVSSVAIREITGVGLLFLVLQLAGAVAYTSDNLVITHYLGPSAVSQYAVHEKMFSVIPMILGMILMPLWPAYGEALERKDGVWVRAVLMKSIRLSLLFSAAMALAIGLMSNYLFSIWLGKGISIVPSLIIALGVWKVVEALASAMAMFLNGVNVVKVQVVVSLTTASLAILMKIMLIGTVGISAVVISSIVTFLIAALIPYFFAVRSAIVKL